jgi:hypothetical protein
MLGLRLSPDEEKRFTRYAREMGRPKSTLAREWLMERLDRESLDAEFRRQVASLSNSMSPQEVEELEAATDEWLRALDAEDGGYDWGPEGPPL